MSSWFKDLTDQVQSALPTFDAAAVSGSASTLLQSLTLTTPELTAERERIDAEEKRKEYIRNALSGMLPWQTRDTERDILVEECKDAILLLSSNKETFFGPFLLPPMKTKAVTAKSDDENTDAENVLDGTPSTESLEKLAKLQPLPPLLENFELLAHVGLIEKVLNEDPNLVTMQSTLSGMFLLMARQASFCNICLLSIFTLIAHIIGGGTREHIFWKNYFFHCAYTRYEAGLSIDEIWSDDVPDEHPPDIDFNNKNSSSSQTLPCPPVMASQKEEAEETITFDAADVNAQVKDEMVTATTGLFGQDTIGTKEIRTESDYEMIDEDKLLLDTSLNNSAPENVPSAGADEADYELDELEAEIARELED